MRRIVVACVAVAAVLAVVFTGVLEGAPAPRSPAPFGSLTLAYACGGRICVWDGAADKLHVHARVPGLRDSRPVWSPDGSRLAFVHTRRGQRYPPREDLYVVNADGSGRTRVATSLGYTSFGLPFAWAPDGKRLAVTLDPTRGPPRQNVELSLTGARGDLFVVDVTGRRRHRLTRSTAMDAFPAWVDDHSVAYVRQRPGHDFPDEASGPFEIRIVDTVSGRNRLVLRRRGGILNLVPSPDRRSAAVLEDGVRISVLDFASGRETARVSYTSARAVGWSPDGTRLALSEGAIVDVASRRVLRKGVVDDCYGPDWSPDGRWIVCSHGYGEEDEERRGGSDLMLVRPGTVPPSQLTDTAKASSPRWRPAVAAP